MKNLLIIISLLISTISFSQSDFQAIYSKPLVTQLSNKKLFSKQESNASTVIPIEVPAGMNKLYFSFAFLPPTVGTGKVEPLTKRLKDIQSWGHDVDSSFEAFCMPEANKVKLTVLSDKNGKVDPNDINKTPILKHEKTVSLTDIIEVEPGETVYFMIENEEKWKDTKIVFEAATYGVQSL